MQDLLGSSCGLEYVIPSPKSVHLIRNGKIWPILEVDAIKTNRHGGKMHQSDFIVRHLLQMGKLSSFIHMGEIKFKSIQEMW